MSVWAATQRLAVRPKDDVAGVFPVLPLGMYLWIVAITASIGVIDRIYQGLFVVSRGLDASSGDYFTYWYSLMAGSLALATVVNFAAWAAIWMTRPRTMEGLSAKDELRRWYILVGWFVWTIGIGFHFSWLGEQDPSFHQILVRDTSFTPSHIIIFYQVLPIVIGMEVATFLYGYTRIPMFNGKILFAWGTIPVAVAWTLANVAFNEWGHTFWFPEELFIAPLHWGFATAVWFLVSNNFATLAATTPRIMELFRIVGQECAAERAAAAGVQVPANL